MMTAIDQAHLIANELSHNDGDEVLWAQLVAEASIQIPGQSHQADLGEGDFAEGPEYRRGQAHSRQAVAADVPHDKTHSGGGMHCVIEVPADTGTAGR
jgi:hypothetical protein